MQETTSLMVVYMAELDGNSSTQTGYTPIKTTHPTKRHLQHLIYAAHQYSCEEEAVALVIVVSLVVWYAAHGGASIDVNM
jgi:hypothetical protein